MPALARSTFFVSRICLLGNKKVSVDCPHYRVSILRENVGQAFGRDKENCPYLKKVVSEKWDSTVYIRYNVLL